MTGNKLISGEMDLLFVSFPQFVSASFQRESEDGNENGRQCRPKLGMTNPAPDFQERNIQYIVWLTLLGCACVAGFAYIYVDGMKYKDSKNQQKYSERQERREKQTSPYRHEAPTHRFSLTTKHFLKFTPLVNKTIRRTQPKRNIS